MTLQRRHLLLATTPLSARADVPLRVVASFSILADWLRQIGGDAVQVDALVGPDADAHVFSPRPSDARKLAEAELIAVVGLGFEGWLQRLVKASGSEAPLVVASQGLKTRRGGHHANAPDPHFWHDLGLTRQALRTLRDALSRARPTAATGFAQRCAAYEAQLEALQAELLALFAPVPPALRRVLTSHDAFAYFGAAQQIRFLSPKGLSTEAEPSAAAVVRLIAQIRRERVRAVFVENISDPRLLQRIAAEAGVAVGGRLYSDALSAPGGPADSYLKLIRHNAQAIAGALRGPAR